MPNNKIIPRRTIQHQKRYLKYLDFEESAKMAEWGLSNKLISKETGLSCGQVSYRLKRLGIRIRDFRNGESETFKYAMQIMNEKHYLQDLKEKIENKMQEIEILRLKSRENNKRKMAA